MMVRNVAPLALTGILLILPGAVASGQTPAPTTGSGVTVPAAPTDLIILGGSLIQWKDKSDNEDGFRITYRTFGGTDPERSVSYETAADVTQFVLPPDAPRLHCGHAIALDLTIVAFNQAGESEMDRYGLIVDCFGPQTPQLPPAGNGSGNTVASRSLRVIEPSATAAAIVLLMAGAAAVRGALRRR